MPDPIIHQNPGVLPPVPRVVRLIAFHCTQCLSRGDVEIPAGLTLIGNRPRCPYCGTRDNVIVESTQEADAGVYARAEAVALDANALLKELSLVPQADLESIFPNLGPLITALRASLGKARAGFRVADGNIA